MRTLNEITEQIKEIDAMAEKQKADILDAVREELDEEQEDALNDARDALRILSRLQDKYFELGIPCKDYRSIYNSLF